MTEPFKARHRGALAGVPAVFAVVLSATILVISLTAGAAHAHIVDVVGGTVAHAKADGVIGNPSVDKRRWLASDRRRRAAIRKRWRYASRHGIMLLSDQQIRERVLLEALGVPLAAPQPSDGGFASATGTYAIDRAGKQVSAPTSKQLSRATMSYSADDVTPTERATKGEWSLPVQPNYPTYGPNTPPATGFPNPEYADGKFPGDPIIDTSQDYSANPDNTGLLNARYWSPNPRIIPIFEAMLPNGKVLYWDWYFSGNMEDTAQNDPDNKGTRILLWDPAHPDQPGVRKDVAGQNLFCAGFSQLPNGDLLLAGGNANTTLQGLNTTFVYHWRTGLWDASDHMYRERWYPSVAATWNGESLIVGGDPHDENGQYAQGGNAVPEVFTSNYTNPQTTQNWDPNNPASHIRKLGALDWPYNDSGNPHVPGWRLYPFLFPWPDGRVLYAGRETPIVTIDQRVKGAVDSNSCSPAVDASTCNDGGDRYVTERADGQDNGGRQITRTYGTGAYYGLGKAIVTAGDNDRVYDFNVPDSMKGPGFDTYDPDTDPQIDAPDPNANWVCQGYAGGTPYAYSGNPYAANATTHWTGDAPIVHVWNKAWCVGTNTPVNNTDNLSVNGASKEAALIGMRTTEDDSLAQPQAPGWPTTQQTQSMHYPRRMANLTILPTGKLVATGGMATTNAADDDVSASEATAGVSAPKPYAMNANDATINSQLVNYDRAVFASEMWDPDTGSWTVMDSEHRPREYHSTTVLLPDGRLMSGGGGVCSTCTYALYSESNFEFYSPPYLFWPNGDAKAANQRPAISASSLHSEGTGSDAASVLNPVDYDDSLSFNYSRAAGQNPGDPDVDLDKAVLVKLGDPTHGFDQGQRYVPVDLTVNSPTSATIKAPPNPFEAPPGYYWLFLIDKNGTPSVARAVQIGASLALNNKLKTATAYAERNLSDPYSADLGSSQDFGLGSYYASHGNLADVRDNSMSSLKIDSGFYARLCRGETFTDNDQCITIPAGTYNQLGTRWEDHISSMRVYEGNYSDTGNNAAAVQSVFDDETPPTLTITSPLDGSSTSNASVPLTYTVSDDVSETGDADSPITCSAASGASAPLTTIGVNTLSVECHDLAGYSTTKTVSVTRTGLDNVPPSVTITAPEDNSTVREDHVTLEYTVSDNVTLNPVCDKPSGTVIPLVVGANAITVVCHDSATPANFKSVTIHVAYIPPDQEPTGGVSSSGKSKVTVPKTVKNAKSLKLKAYCEERCAVTIGITATGLSYWPKAAMLNGSTKTRTVTFKLPHGTYKQIAGLLKKHKKVKLRAWVNDKIQGAAKLKR